MLVNIVAVQTTIGQPLSLEEKIYILKQRPDFVCLPEYFLINSDIPTYHRAALHIHDHLNYLTRLSADVSTCLIGGSVVEPAETSLYNTSYLINRGNILAGYRKRFPVEGELKGGIVPGSDIVVYDIEGVRVGLMICGDVFYPEMYLEMAERDVDVIFIPTTSKYRPDDTDADRQARDRRYFISGAETAGAYVVKVNGVGEIFGFRLQGRSLVAAPWGIVEAVEPANEQKERIFGTTLDIEEIRDFRLKRQRRQLSKSARKTGS